jgi:hypothetical protein
MKKIELIFLLNVLFAIVAVLVNYPMAGQFLVVSVGILSVFYMYLGFTIFCDIPLSKMFKKETYADINKNRIVGAFALGMGISASLIGLLFKVLMWPNSQTQLQIGLVGLIVAGGISVWRFVLNKSDFYIRVFIRLAIYIPVTAISLFIPKYAILEYQYRNYPAYVEAFKTNSENPNDPELQMQLDEAWKEMNKVETKP